MVTRQHDTGLEGAEGGLTTVEERQFATCRRFRGWSVLVEVVDAGAMDAVAVGRTEGWDLYTFAFQMGRIMKR